MEWFTAAAIAGAFALAGCGSTQHAITKTVTATTPSSTAAPATTAATPTAGPYENMTVLGQAVKTTYNTKYRKGGSPVTVMNCIKDGANSAECNATFADGSTQSVAVTIASDGGSWISH